MTSPNEPVDLLGAAERPPPGQKLTAEERLFQVIENGGTPPKPGGFRKILERLKGLVSPKGEGRKFRFDLAFVNRLMALGGVLVLAGAVVNFFLFKPDISRVYGRVAEVQAAPQKPDGIASPRTDDEYLFSITRRSLFQPVKEGELSSTTGTPNLEIPRTNIDAVLSNLELVGISWGVYPEAMIRTKNGGRTYFIKEGDKFEQVLVKEIMRDRVIVEYAGQIKELM